MIVTKGRTMVLIVVMMMGLSLVPLAPGAQANTVDWVVEGQIPGERTAFAWAELPDGQIFLGLGYNSTAFAYRNDSWILDPYEMTCTRLADAPLAVTSTTAAYLAGKVYIFGGMDSSYVHLTNVLIYDLDADAWSTGAALPQTGTHIKCVAIDDRHILLAGGQASHWDRCYLFDVQTGTFDTAPNLPDGRAGGTLLFMGTVAYYIGGWDYGYGVCKDIFGYDVVYDYWWSVDELPSPLIGITGVVGSDGLMYLLGGGLDSSWGSGNTEQAMAWDPNDERFIDLPDLAEPLRYGAAFELTDGRIIYFGGHNVLVSSEDLYSIQAWTVEASLDTDSIGQGESAWLSLSVHANFADVNGIYGIVYLTAMDVTYASYYFEALGNMVLVEIPISQETPAQGYVLELSDVGANWKQDFTIEPLALTVTDTPSLGDCLDDLEEQNQALQDQLNEAKDELKEATDAKLDAMIGYVILMLALAALIVGVVILVRKK